MSKEEFLAALRTALEKLPEHEIRASLDFYAEMIDDRMEDGATEEEAVAALGNVRDIAMQIAAETPPIPKAVAKMKTANRTTNIVLAVVLSPIWIPLAMSFALCVAAVYLSLWAVIVSLWCCVAVLILCGPIGIAGLIWCLATGNPLTGLWLLGCGLAGSGLGLFALLGMKAVSRGLVQLTGLFANKVKGLFVRKANLPSMKKGAETVVSEAKGKAATVTAGAKDRAAAMAESARAAIHTATAPRQKPDSASEAATMDPTAPSNASTPARPTPPQRGGSPIPPPGYAAASGPGAGGPDPSPYPNAPHPTPDQTAKDGSPTEGGDHDHRA